MVPADVDANEPSPSGLVLGTAGHIDHGKTALVAALTGVDTDRLPEEKARGITISLGFAALDIAGTRVSVIDVPGHEKLVRTMVSGAAGIDLLVLIVAADEGVMPQTREHVAICNLLGIERCVVALTKSDLVDDEMRELASEEVADLLAPTSLAESKIIPVSSVTGEGIDTLREALAEVIESGAPRTTRSGPPRLGIDRLFAIRGFGTVATGTLVGSSLSVGDSVVIYPDGVAARVRGLQSHDVSVDTAPTGVRCAVNLQGVDVADLSRGQVISHADALAPTQTLDVDLWWLDEAPEGEEVLSIEFLAGTAERRARLAPIGRRGFAPGERSFARVHIDGDPVALLPGDRFIARGFARQQGTGGTLGGGIVLDVAPPHRRRSDPDLERELEVLRTGDDRAHLRERILRNGLAGVSAAELRRETGVRAKELRELLAKLAEDGAILQASGERWIGAEVVLRMEQQLLAALDAFHAAQPLRPGMPRAALRGQLPENVDADSAELALSRLQATGLIERTNDLVRRVDFAPTLSAETESKIEQIAKEAASTGLEPPNPRDWAEAQGVSLEEFRDLVAHLEREGRLLRAPGDLWFDRSAVDGLCERVVAHLEKHGELDTQTYKGIIATTRRTAMPLMELLDELHITRRSGDVRILRSGGARDSRGE